MELSTFWLANPESGREAQAIAHEKKIEKIEKKIEKIEKKIEKIEARFNQVLKSSLDMDGSRK